MNSERLLSRFLQYVAIDSMARDGADQYPSSPGQRQLGQLVLEQLREAGVADARLDEHGLVWATIPANVARACPVIAFNAHLDTSPEASGADVRPQVIRGYRGGDLVLPGDRLQVIRVRDNPALESLLGGTLVTTDGTTLLGGDDKAGVAVIVETAAYLAEHPEIAHGLVRLLFTCDEEIGRGVQHVDLAQLAATVCYTLDGRGADEVDVATFSADLATVTIRGRNIHPSIAKGRMVNAIRAAADFIARLPQAMSPETTEGREGFLHPYQLKGGVAEVVLKIILRDFVTERLAEQAEMLHAIARQVQEAFPEAAVRVDTAKQYRNMAEGLVREPRAVALAQAAHRRLNREPKLTIIRGGTDGSQLTERGLPTPNLSVGQHNPHSNLEWVCLDEMAQAAAVLVELVQLWAEA